MKKCLTLCLVTIFVQSNMQVTAQCTEAKDAEMAKYMKLTKTQDAQGCSQCGMLALYFCSAKYSVKEEDVQKVGALIAACKTNIRNMGQPYCCPDYLTKEPQWGIMAGNAGNKKAAGSGTASLNENAKTGNTNAANNAQKLQQTEEVLNALLKQLETDPANPLNIDAKFLNDFTGLLPEGSLKNTLQSYGANLGTDADLSYRQVYWDVASGFKQNSTLVNNSQFANTAHGLNIMFDNFTLLSAKLKSNGAKYEFGAFINDPQLIKGLSNITGSYESAQALGNGIELVSMLSAIHSEEKKMKEDYKKLSKLSNDYLYIENDANLGSALIDACLGIIGHQLITSIYRYDFDNGASLRVENGILKYFNVKKGIIKNLMLVDKRHDGKFYKTDDRGYQLSTIIISPDEKVFYLYANPEAISDIKCADCLKKCGYTIDTETGEIIYSKIEEKYGWNSCPSAGGILNDTRFNKNNIPISYEFAAKGNFFWTYKSPFTSRDKKLENMEGLLHPKFGIVGAGLDKEKNFRLNNKERKFKTAGEFSESLFDFSVKFHYVYEKDSSYLNLFWGSTLDEKGLLKGDGTRYSGSMIQIARKDEYYNADGMINEITGIAMSQSGDLYFASHNGYIGKMKGTDYKLNDPSLASKMRSAMDKKIFASYNFIASKTYVSVQGLLRQDDPYSIYPAMKLTPDEKLITYTVNDNLYLVNTDDLSKVNHYKLGCQPYNYFFTKENGDWVINLQSLNEFKFPVTKKYSIPKMLRASEASEKLSGNKTSATDLKNTNFSLADEIKKLKELLDTGTITKEEFDAAKKQLLNNK